MAIIKDFGVVLREYEAGENNKKLVVLTRGHGKMTVFARGARRTGSKLATGLFSYNEFVIFEGTNFYSLNAVMPVHIFDIADDYDKFCYGHSFLEMTDKMVLASMDTSEVLNILLCAFVELARGSRHKPSAVFAVFAIKLLKTEGFAPLVDADGTIRTGENTLGLTPEAAQAITYIMEANPKEMFAFKASDDVAEQLYRAARLFVAENVDVKIKSLEMIGD